MSAAHTATPWNLVDNGLYFEIVVPWSGAPEVIDQYCPKICTVSYQDNDGIKGTPNAEFIVRACNAHDDLVKALKLMLDAFYYDPLDANRDVAIECAEDALAKVGAA
jgi:hypothetical protein